MWYSQNFKKGPLFGLDTPSPNMTQSNYSSRNGQTPIKIVQNKVSIAQKNLQKGYFATKYSKDGFFIH